MLLSKRLMAPAVEEWTPADLFQVGDVGAWYDSSDLTTVFQNIGGTTEVTADGDPVALVTDKLNPSGSAVAGPEEITNGDGTSTTGWTTTSPVTLTVNGSNQFEISRNSGGVTDFPTQTILTNGKRYLLSFEVIALSNGITAYMGSTSSKIDVTSVGVHEVVLFATGTDFFIGPTLSTTATCTIDNISVKELPAGSNAWQNDATYQPVYKTDGTLHWFEFNNSALDTPLLFDKNGFTYAATINPTYTGSEFQGVINSFDGVSAEWTNLGVQKSAGEINFDIDNNSNKRTISDSSAAGNWFVAVAKADSTNSAMELRVNAVSTSLTHPITGTIVAVNEERIGARAGDTSINYFVGRVGQILIIDRELSASEVDDLENYFADKAGVTL